MIRASRVAGILILFTIWHIGSMAVAAKSRKAEPGPQELWMQRFKGLEIYTIETARWNLYRDDEDGRMNLWIYVECGKAKKQFEDTEYVGGEPHWELNLVQDTLAEETLTAGFEATIPEGYDESRGGWVTNFYFVQHAGSDKNTLEVLEVDGDRMRIRLTGEIVDVNFYDDSKPRSKLLVETWFTRDAAGRRSMS